MASALSLVRPAVTPNPSGLAAREPALEDALVDRARRGDVHAGRVHALCLRLVGEPTEAQELVQDTFIHAWEALPRFRGESSLTTWLHRIAVNAMLERRRRDRRRSARVSLAEDDDDESATSGSGFVAPADVATAIDLERAIAALPPGVRRAFVLHEVEGYTHEEVAGMTGLATGTLRAQLHRARQLLIRALSL